MALGDKDSFALLPGTYTMRSSFATQQSSLNSSANLREESSIKKRRPAFFTKSSNKFSIKSVASGPRLKVDNAIHDVISLLRSTAMNGKGLFASTASCIETPDLEDLVSPRKAASDDSLVFEEVPIDSLDNSYFRYQRSDLVGEERPSTRPYESLKRKAPCT